MRFTVHADPARQSITFGKLKINLAEFILNMALTLPIVFGLARYATGSKFFSYAHILTLLGGLMCAVTITGITARARQWTLLLFFSLLLCMIGALFMRRPLNINAIFFAVEMLTNCYIAHLIVKRGVSIHFSAKFLLLSFWAFFLYKGILLGFSPDNVNVFFSGSSRNMVSGVAIFLQIFYSTTFWLRHNRLPIVSSFITVALCLIAFGRTGVLLSSILFALTMLSYWKAFRLEERVVVTILCLGLLLLTIEPAFSYLLEETNFKHGFQTSRVLVLQEYFSGFGLREFIFGRAFDGMPTVIRLNGNPHNSFIYGHHLFGGAYFFFLVVVMVIIGRCLFFRRTKILGLLALLLLARSFFDIIAVPGYFDGIFFYIIALSANTSVINRGTEMLA